MNPSSILGQKSIILKIAHVYYQVGNWEKAAVEYEKITKLDACDYNAHATLGELYFKKVEIQKSMEHLEAAVNGFLQNKNEKKAGACFRTLAVLIQKFIEPEDVERAVALYQSILRRMPDCLEATANLRDLYSRHNQTEETVRYSCLLGDLYRKMDYLDQAQNEYSRACQLEPGNIEIERKLEQVKNETDIIPTPTERQPFPAV